MARARGRTRPNPLNPQEATIPQFAAEIRVTPREGVLDPEGQTIGSALENLGYDEVDRVRAGRLVRLRLSAEDAAAAHERVVKMCEELIANPVIEDYDVRVEPDGAGDDPTGGDGAGDDPARGDGA